MNADGSNQHRLTSSSAASDEPSWSRDGRFVAFQSERDGNNEIYLIDAAVGESRADTKAGQTGPKSIAVLPFKTPGAEGDNQYLGAGMSDLLTTKLSQIRRLTVRPSGELRRYATSTADPRQAGRELGVDYLLDGEVRQSGDHLQVSATLFNVAGGSALWSEKFDQRFVNLRDVQDAISDRVVRAMTLELTSDERSQFTKNYTENREAYQLYLIGRYHAGKRTPEGLRQAVKSFEQAIEKDRNYALAYAGLADAYGLLGLYDAVPSEQSFQKSKEAATRALAIDDTLAEAHNSLAFVKLYYDRDLAGAEEEFKTAIELKPNYSTAHHWHALNLSAMGQHDQAVAEIQKARELDPLSLIINTAVGNILYYAGLYDRSIEQCLKTIQMDQRFVPAHIILRQNYEQKGMSDEALAEYQKERALSGDGPVMAARLAHVYASAGRRDEALKIINGLVAARKQQFVSAYELARVFAVLGEDERALEWLRKARDEHAIGFSFVKVDPDFNRLRQHPLFTELLQQFGPTR
jgi:TolB-like protein/Tfp pilus assembly protein PilF